MRTLELLREIITKFPDMNAYERAVMQKQIYRALPKILDLVDTAEQTVVTVDKVMQLTDAYINVNISGKDFRFDATAELKQKLAALREEVK